MSRDVVATLPSTTYSFAGCGCNELFRIAHLGSRERVSCQFARAAGEFETAIDQWRAKEPLRDEHPPRRDQSVSENSSDAPHRKSTAKTWMHEHEHGERERRPEPADLHKVDIEDVLLQRKVARREFRRMRLRVCRVRRSARGGRYSADYAAHEQSCGVNGDEQRFEAGREEGRASCAGGGRSDGAPWHAGGYGRGAVLGDGGIGVFAASCHCCRLCCVVVNEV